MPGILTTAVICGLIALWVSLSLRKLWKDKKSGKTCCGGGCSHCAGCGKGKGKIK